MEYGLLGEHLPHSFSPEIHSRIGDYSYELMELPPEKVAGFLRERNFRGINVTIPYKQLVMEHLDEISEEALQIGAVNTIVNRNGRLYGYNTDCGGLMALFHHAGIDPSGKKVLILGSGGTAHTAHTAVSMLGAEEIHYVSRQPDSGEISYKEAVTLHSDAAILVNTTPCGMFPKPDGMAIDPTAFPQLCGVIDVVYNPLRTKLVQHATAQGISAEGGLYMLVQQAILAAEHFFGRPVPSQRAEEIFRSIQWEKENIVLTGMPASGKSTVGRQLAANLQRPFYDLDEEIVRSVGCSIPEIFAKQGEAAFRDMESRVLREVLSGKTGCVIATGGGAILREENVRYLRQNGRIYFLDRPLALLCPTEDRPTASSSAAMAKRYEERYPLYCACCDVRIHAAGTVDEVTKEIEGEFLT